MSDAALLEAFKREALHLDCGLPVEEIARAFVLEVPERGLLQEGSSLRLDFA